jgi:hypothetical protein
VNFHSFRRWFVSRALDAAQPQRVVSMVVGHKEGFEGITVASYWRGADDATLRACVEAVKLPPAISLLAPTPAITRKGRVRKPSDAA